MAQRELTNDEDAAYQKALQENLSALQQGAAPQRAIIVLVPTDVLTSLPSLPPLPPSPPSLPSLLTLPALAPLAPLPALFPLSSSAVPAVQQDTKTLAANVTDAKAAEAAKRSSAAVIKASQAIETTVHDHRRPRMDVRVPRAGAQRGSVASAHSTHPPVCARAPCRVPCAQSIFGALDAQLAAMNMTATRAPTSKPAAAAASSAGSGSPARGAPATATAAAATQVASSGTAAAPAASQVVEPPELLLPLTAAEAKAHPIRASAHNLKVAVSKWDERGNPLVSSSKSAADKLKRLSDGLHSGQPKMMIESAAGIFTVRCAVQQ